MYWTILALALSIGDPAQSPAPQPPGPSPEMARFARLVVGSYRVLETHHARPGVAEWSVDGTSTYRPGPDGLSVIEDYRSNNPRGPFSAIAVLWWDQDAKVFKHFECETGEPCGVVEDQGTWQGDVLVFSSRRHRQGRTVLLEKRYDFSAPGVFVYQERASVDGGQMFPLMTIAHTRQSPSATIAYSRAHSRDVCVRTRL